MFKLVFDVVCVNLFLFGVKMGMLEIGFSNGNWIVVILLLSRLVVGVCWFVWLFDELWGYIYMDVECLWVEVKIDLIRVVLIKIVVGYVGYDDFELWLVVLESGKVG